jgi:hypothetical protein
MWRRTWARLLYFTLYHVLARNADIPQKGSAPCLNIVQRSTVVPSDFHHPVNVPTAGAQAFLMDYKQGKRAISHYAGPVRIGGCGPATLLFGYYVMNSVDVLETCTDSLQHGRSTANELGKL